MDRLNDVCFEFAVANGASDTVVCFALFLNTLEDHMAVVSPDILRYIDPPTHPPTHPLSFSTP